MAVTPEFIEQVSEALEELGYNVEQEEDVISDVSEINDDVTLPGIRVQGGSMTGYATIKLAVLKAYLDNTVTAIQGVWNTWFGTSDQEGVRKTWGNWFSARSTEWGTLKIDVQTAIVNTNNATAAAQQATEGAENVNAGIQGFTVTVTDRKGVTRSVDIGFGIYRTYESVESMNADADNVPQGKFVIIATTDKTSEDNAKMYVKDSQGSFTFLCDLDQVSSSAWADWLNNMKPEIEQATIDANNAADLAGQNAELAQTAADNADASRQQIEANEQTRQNNEQDRVTAETHRQTIWTEWFSDTLPTGVRKMWNDFWNNAYPSWNTFFGTNENEGVRKEWSDLKEDAIQETQAAHRSAENANEKAALANEKAAQADEKASLANEKAALANEKASLADDNAAYAREQGDYARQQGNYAKAWNDHPPYIGDGITGDKDYWYIWNSQRNTYEIAAYAKGDNLHWEEMSQEEKDALARSVLAQLSFASKETCKSIIGELV